MKGRAGVAEQLLAAVEVEAVVDIATVGCAAVRRDQLGPAQCAQVVGGETLRQLERAHQLAHAAVAPRELAQQAPPQRVPGELEEHRRLQSFSGFRMRAHGAEYT